MIKNREKFYKSIGFSGNLDDYEWHEHWKYSELYVCKEGFIKKNIRGTDKVLGSLTEENYVKTKIGKSILFVHRIIIEYILKRDLKEGEIVDHINCIRYDNSFSNLRVTDAKGNMNN